MTQVERASLMASLWENFLGHSPPWYKKTIIAFLAINALSLLVFGPFVTGWLLVAEFIFTLAMALQCYPLQPGGLLVLQAIVMGLSHPDVVRKEVLANFPVILLLMFMVAGIYFMRDMLLFVFTKLLLRIRSKSMLSLAFCAMGALLSAFLDALTVIAVVITVATGFYSVYHRASSTHADGTPDAERHREDLAEFRQFLRDLLMHAAVGTALGGVCTLVGEPQNLLIGNQMGWNFGDFFQAMAPVTMPTLIAGFLTCLVVEKLRWFGYGGRLPSTVREVLRAYDQEESAARSRREIAALWVQALAAGLLVIALAFHWAEVGLIGLMVIVLQTALNGVVEEARIGKAFEEALPFTGLLVVFFGVVAVIDSQGLFRPVIEHVLSLDQSAQPAVLYVANGLLSAISDNVFVATIYINEVKAAFEAGQFEREHFERLAVAINTGTNLPSVATPNGQAAFLFLLTSAVAPLVRLSYTKMVVMALPYTLVLSLMGLMGVQFWL